MMVTSPAFGVEPEIKDDKAGPRSAKIEGINNWKTNRLPYNA